jgi:hypothetical protein
VEFGTRVQFPPLERAIRGTPDTELPIRQDGRHSLRAVRPEMKPGRGVSLPKKPRALPMLPSKSDAPFERFTDKTETRTQLGPISDSAALWIARMAALECLVPSASTRPFISLSCSRDDDRLKGSASVSCSQRGDEAVYPSVLFSRRRSFEGQRSGVLFPARR